MTRILSLCLLLLCLTACSFEGSRRPSLLVIAVDGLGFDQVACDEQGPLPSGTSIIKDSGFKTLCQNSVRFTHAYTPSLLSQPALVSLLTARHPHEHGVWHNGHTFLTAGVKTASEVAIERGYRTHFVSGGAPIWRKSGLSQGIESFDDNIGLSSKNLNRPIAVSVQKTTDWIRQLGRGESFFSVIFSNDLRFPEQQTVSNFSETRSLTRRSQLEEVNETLGQLFSELEKQGRWNDTFIFLAGLNSGIFKFREGRVEPQPLNPFKENVHVALLIKPATRDRDMGLQWKVDKNVSLTDVGATLFDILIGIVPQPPSRSFEVVSLRSVLVDNLADWGANRAIPIESSWASWHGIGNHRLSIRRGHYLYLHNSEPKVYNTLTDSEEQRALDTSDIPGNQKIGELARMADASGFQKWDSPQEEASALFSQFGNLEIPDLWGADEATKAKNHLRNFPNDGDVAGWLAIHALWNENWGLLHSLGDTHSKPVWKYVALRNKGERTRVPEGSCYKLFNRKLRRQRRALSQDCKDNLMPLVIQWDEESDSTKKTQYREKFFRSYSHRRFDQRIEFKNISLKMIWRRPSQINTEPSVSELWLALPENRARRKALVRRFKLGQRKL